MRTRHDRSLIRLGVAAAAAAALVVAGCATAAEPSASGPPAVTAAAPTTAVPASSTAPVVIGASAEAAASDSSATEPASAPTTAVATTAVATTAVATTAVATTAARRPITLGFAGDTSFTHGLDGRDPFGAIADLLRQPDLMVVNLETAVAETGVGSPPIDKQFLFLSPPASVQLLVDAGIDAVSLANNHALDYGNAALDRTMQLLDSAGVIHVGASDADGDPWPGRVIEVGDWQVGLAAFSRVPCGWADGGGERPGVAWACDPFHDRMLASVDDLVASADVVAVMLHGGTEAVFCADGFMLDLFDLLASHGVDMVVSGHPHRLQGVSRDGTTWVVHSTGNFTFPSARGDGADSGVFLFEVSEAGITLSVEPVRTPAGIAEPVPEPTRERILDHIAAHSPGWGFDAAGQVIETAEAGRCAR